MLTDSEYQSLMRVAAFMGKADPDKDNKEDETIIAEVLDTFDPYGEVGLDLAERDNLLAAYFTGEA